MQTEEKPRSKSGAVVVIVAGIVLLLPPLYVLSAGPANWLVRKGYIDADQDSWVMAFYFPLRILVASVPAVGRFFDLYLSLFE